MTLSEELTWRGFINQTTIKDITVLDKEPIAFYFGVDPSADSMQIGNLAAAMMVKAFLKHGHQAFLLVGGATGLIGDPDGKRQERDLKSLEEIAKNKRAIASQYQTVFEGQAFQTVDNYDWFQDMHYLDFLREIGKHVPMRQMLQRDFVQSRLGEQGAGISYAEFSYVLIQAYDFLYLHEHHGVTLQVCGSDQWGNSIAGVDLIRRKTGDEAHVFSVPLIVNKTTGQKFGKSEGGAVWLDPQKTSPTQFYQFWINVDDEGVEEYLKVFTELEKPTIDALILSHVANRQARLAQKRLAEEVTRLVHGDAAVNFAQQISDYLTGVRPVIDADEVMLGELKKHLPFASVSLGDSITAALVTTGLATSQSDARRLLESNAISLNGSKISRTVFETADFGNGKGALLRRGKAFKDSALILRDDA